VFLTTQLNFALCPTRVCTPGYPLQPCLHENLVVVLCVRACVEHSIALLKFVCCRGRMLWPATHVHARAEHVPPPHGTLALSTVRGSRGVLVPSQAGVATQVCWVSRHAFLAGQDVVAERCSFVTPPRSSCRKLSGVLTVRPDAGVGPVLS
jgi:hypothetical protein